MGSGKEDQQGSIWEFLLMRKILPSQRIYRNICIDF